MVQVSAGPKGGYFVLTVDGSKLEHNCPKRVPRRVLSHRHGRTGWFEVTIKRLRTLPTGHVLEIAGLADCAPFTVKVEREVLIDTALPAFYRDHPGSLAVEIGYFAVDGVSLTSVIYGYRI
jgi:hypothetical protein